MLEVDRDLAHKVFDLLEAGKTPYAVAAMEITSVRTVRRLKAALEGFETGGSDNDISRTTGWRAKRVTLIRRWWEERRSATEQGGADIELGLHRREMFYFGQRFRDLVCLPPPNKVVTMTTEEYKGAMWQRRLPDLGVSYRDPEEEAVDREWRSLPQNDARKHSLYKAFQQHLSSHSKCWGTHSCMKKAYNAYGGACRKASQAILGQLRGRLPGLSEDRIEVLAEPLLVDGFYRKGGKPGLDFSYDVHEARQEGLLRWELKLAACFILADDPAELRTLADVHQQLRASPPYDAELNALDKAERKISEAAASFQASLSPDALLRKLVRNGRCEWCP